MQMIYFLILLFYAGCSKSPADSTANSNQTANVSNQAAIKPSLVSTATITITPSASANITTVPVTKESLSNTESESANITTVPVTKESLSNTESESAIAPILLTLLPATAAVNPIPPRVRAIFSKPVAAVLPSQFTIGGTCSSLPIKGTVSMENGNTIASLMLSGGACTNGQTVTVSIDPTLSIDSGNLDTVLTNIYTFSTIGPIPMLGTPIKTTVKGAPVWTIPLTISSTIYGGTTTLTGTLTPTGGGIEVIVTVGVGEGTVNPTCVISVGSITPTGATISVQKCVLPSNIVFADIGISVLPGIAKDSVGNFSSESNGVGLN